LSGYKSAEGSQKNFYQSQATFATEEAQRMSSAMAMTNIKVNNQANLIKSQYN
jgi:hypothetical protein